MAPHPDFPMLHFIIHCVSFSLSHTLLFFSLKKRRKKSLSSKYCRWVKFWALRYWETCAQNNLECEYERKKGGGTGAIQCKEARREHKNALQTLSSGLSHSWVFLVCLERLPFLVSVQLSKDCSQSCDWEGVALTSPVSSAKCILVIRHRRRSN